MIPTDLLDLIAPASAGACTPAELLAITVGVPVGLLLHYPRTCKTNRIMPDVIYSPRFSFPATTGSGSYAPPFASGSAGRMVLGVERDIIMEIADNNSTVFLGRLWEGHLMPAPHIVVAAKSRAAKAREAVAEVAGHWRTSLTVAIVAVLLGLGHMLMGDPSIGVAFLLLAVLGVYTTRLMWTVRAKPQR